ncbi:MAG: PilZ domain-containing protein [Candidatus Omnitrophica bacterium]|nr:PilZ domain-containing protein [Candidatus Omnitrophota bacterium]
MGGSESDHRGEKRIEYHFIVRIRLVKPSGAAAWDVSTIRNISKTGLLFYSSNYYDHNADVEARIKNPIIPEEIICLCKVVRCELLKNMKDIYSVAVEITEMAPESREAYDKTIKLFMDRTEHPK